MALAICHLWRGAGADRIAQAIEKQALAKKALAEKALAEKALAEKALAEHGRGVPA